MIDKIQVRTVDVYMYNVKGKLKLECSFQTMQSSVRRTWT